jgi:hypothetical protein
VARELTALCTTATPEPVLQRMHEDGGLTWPQLQRLRDPHQPQGAPTSAALAKLCAFRLDLRLDGLAHVLGARYTRHADDIVLSGGQHLYQARPRIEAWVGRMALEESFHLNHRKTLPERRAPAVGVQCRGQSALETAAPRVRSPESRAAPVCDGWVRSPEPRRPHSMA